MAQPYSGRSYVVTLTSGSKVRMRYLSLADMRRIRKLAFLESRETPDLSAQLAAEMLTEASIVEVSADLARDAGVGGDLTGAGFVPVDDADAGRRKIYHSLESRDRDLLDVAYARKNALTREDASPLLAAITDEVT